MSSRPGMDLQTRLVELKQRFDASFAEPPPAAAGEYEDVLVIGLGSEQYRVRLREIEGMYPERPLTEVPSHAPHLLGVSDFRGELVAVYDLAALLGYPRAERTRYLLRSSLRTVGFAFERFLGHARLLKQHTGNVADSLEAHAQSIIDIAKLVDTLEQQAASAASGEA